MPAFTDAKTGIRSSPDVRLFFGEGNAGHRAGISRLLTVAGIAALNTDHPGLSVFLYLEDLRAYGLAGTASFAGGIIDNRCFHLLTSTVFILFYNKFPPLAMTAAIGGMMGENSPFVI